MNMPFLKSTTALIVFLLALMLLSVLGCGNRAPNADTDVGGDADTDTDSDSDADGDTDSAKDTSSTGDTGGDVDTDTDTDTDSDSDVDTDVDTDSDSDSDGDADTSSGTSSDTATEPAWVWVDNPAGEDCGAGCRQITFEDRVNERQWDVWEDKLVYADGWWRIFVVDVEKKKTLKIPDVHSEFQSRPDGTSDSRGLHPTIFQNVVFYSLGIDSTPYRYELVRTDLYTSTQRVIWQQEDPSNEYFLPDYLDAYGDRLVTRSSCGNPQYRSLGYHVSPWSDPGTVLIDRSYGSSNSLWEDTLVFWEVDAGIKNIRGYNFRSESFFDVTNDEEFQYTPRIHKRRVVYMDLRLGESNTEGTWEHGAIFMKDLDSGEVKQITDGAAIASYPDIYDDIIVWMDWSNCPNPNNKADLSAIEIWGYNLVTEKTFQITNLPEYPKGFPRIWGDKVYVHMFKGAKNGIYQFALPASAGK